MPSPQTPKTLIFSKYIPNKDFCLISNGQKTLIFQLPQVLRLKQKYLLLQESLKLSSSKSTKDKTKI